MCIIHIHIVAFVCVIVCLCVCVYIYIYPPMLPLVGSLQTRVCRRACESHVDTWHS